MTDKRLSSGLIEIQESWTLIDLLDAHDVLDALDAAEHTAHERAREQVPRGGR